jgi:hypothetical protein
MKKIMKNKKIVAQPPQKSQMNQKKIRALLGLLKSLNSVPKLALPRRIQQIEIQTFLRTEKVRENSSQFF